MLLLQNDEVKQFKKKTFFLCTALAHFTGRFNNSPPLKSLVATIVCNNKRQEGKTTKKKGGKRRVQDGASTHPGHTVHNFCMFLLVKILYEKYECFSSR